MQEYIQITPVREEVNSKTVTRELYGLHQYGNGRKLPLDMELHIDSIQPTSNFEFVIYKPRGEAQFQFFIGPGERGDVDCDRLESTTRSQYPENFEFNRLQFDITDVFEEVPHMVRFEGVEERRKDWMTMLTRFDTKNQIDLRYPTSSRQSFSQTAQCCFKGCLSHALIGLQRHSDRKDGSSVVFTHPVG